MLGVKLQRQNGGLGIKNNNKKGSLLGVKIYPGKKSSLISYHNNDQKKSYLEK